MTEEFVNNLIHENNRLTNACKDSLRVLKKIKYNLVVGTEAYRDVDLTILTLQSIREVCYDEDESDR